MLTETKREWYIVSDHYRCKQEDKGMKFTKKFRNLSIRVKVALVTAVLLAVGFLCLVTASSKLVRERVTSSMQDQFINETMQNGLCFLSID